MGRWGMKLGDMAEFQCFVCKDAGDVRVCDARNCLKSYHPGCVGKEDDFIDSSEQHVCDWHKCSNCGSDALYLCLCCPSSSACGDCFGKVDFVPVKQSNELNMGFCRSCFNMAIVTEKDDAEEAKVVFEGTPEHYQILFKDYWTILNDKECFTLLDLQLASIRHKRSLQCKEGKDSDEYHKTDGKPLGDNDGAGPSSLLDTMDKPNEVQATLKRKKLEKRTYVGWGSKELTEFLSCIGKNASTPLDHFKVAEVVRDYVRQNNLLDGKKKKSVTCDENLHSLFNKRKFKYNMIHSLVETHLSANAISEDESDGSVDDNGYTVKKKPRNSLEPKIPKSVSGIDPIIPKSVSGINKKCLAALNPNNLNLIYLRRTLVVKLLTELDTFEQKVIGCLVRVKNDLKSYTYMMTKKYYQIGLVTGIKKSSEEYKIKDTCTDVLLCVSGMWDDVKISMLSEEDFEEDECNDLLLLAKKELFKRPTVAELEEKEATVHADIVNHWFDKELRKLEMELERAREKGWRQDIHDLSCKKVLLSTPDERQRRLEAIPEVIPDAEEESKEIGIESAASIPFQGNRDERQRRLEAIPEVIPDAEEKYEETEIDSAARNPFQGNRGVTQTVADPLEVGIDESLEGASLRDDAACEIAFEAAGKALPNGSTPGPGLHTPLNTVTGVIDIDNEEDGNGPSHHNGGDEQDIIDLVSDDDEDVHMEQCEPERARCDGPETVNGIAAHAHNGPEAVNGVTIPTVRASDDRDGNTGPVCSTSQAMARDPVTVNGTSKSDQGWLYRDLQGREHGPYPMAQMREWQQSGYFPEGFRVWRAGKSRRGRGSILLIDAMRLH
ncbi:hypothetical protein CFC21_043314 [Triticum aestivum]|uniref:Uncharacterized protein n=2 Tax=Triticum aestivum TaxID=4565 RepID=A0A9R1JWE0_WHEAT|nr:uncharacterized protein At5g08430-like isoform X2 [Triticum aestivum]KAF7032094.1 hypothetical protein CFC21_043314 [Triticum aestivum]